MIKYSLTLIILLLSLASCKKDEGNNTGTFDRKQMLTEVAEQIIAPSYAALKLSTDSLQNAYTAFEAAPTLSSLEALKQAFRQSYLRWQDCSVFEFGPAMDVSLRNSVNIFPASTTKIENNITAGSYDLSTAANADTKGFPGIDYLLYANDAATTLSNLQGNAARMAYLEALVKEISTKVTTVNSEWQNGYVTTFANKDGNDVGSSLGELVNQLNYDWEIIKTSKLAIPLGKKSLGLTYPEKVEAYYSGMSTELMIRNAITIRNLFTGVNYTTGNDIKSLNDYLKALNAMHTEQPLDEAIVAQLNAAISALQSLPTPLSTAISNDETVGDVAYVEVQKSIVLIKTDMPSALGVLITYQDNDGD